MTENKSYDLSKAVFCVSKFVGGLPKVRKSQMGTDTIVNTHNMASDAASAVLSLFPKNTVTKSLTNAAQAVNAVFAKYGHKLGNSGMFIVPVDVKAEFETEKNDAIALFDKAASDVLSVYAALLTEAQTRNGSLHDPSLYPSEESLKSRLVAGVEYWPLPDSRHFMADVSDDVAAQVKASIEAQVKATVESAVNDLVRRLHAVTSTFVDKLQDYQPGGDNAKVIGIFRDSLVSNLQDTATLIRKLNFTGSTKISGLAAQVERLARYTPDALRADNRLRTDMVAEGKDVLTKLAAITQSDGESDDLIAQNQDYLR